MILEKVATEITEFTEENQQRKVLAMPHPSGACGMPIQALNLSVFSVPSVAELPFSG